jgi:thiol-disulfide isomerase/thioredoxin
MGEKGRFVSCSGVSRNIFPLDNRRKKKTIAITRRGSVGRPVTSLMIKGIQIVLVTLAITIGLYGLLTSKPAPGEPIDLTFTATDGSPVNVASLRGKVVLLDFWATWCPPCREEVPNVVAAYNKYHAQGFEVVGISLDQSRDSLDQFTAGNGMVWPQYFDGQGWGNSLAERFGIHSIPQMWLLDKQGRVVTKDGRENLDGQVADLLKTP